MGTEDVVADGVQTDSEANLNASLESFAARTPQRGLARAVLTSGGQPMLRRTPLQLDEGEIPAVTVAGRFPGTVSQVTYMVPVWQLLPDEAVSLRVAYDPNTDNQLADLQASILANNGLFEALECVYRGETIEDPTSRAVVPLIRIRHGRRRWHALMKLREAGAEIGYYAPININPAELNDGQQLLATLAQQLNRRDLSLLDKAVRVHQLVHEHGFSEEVIAQHVGWSQSRVSRFADAGELAERSEIITEYMAADSLSPEHLARMTVQKYTDELESLELVAEYAVQTRCSSDQVEKILQGMHPSNGIEPYFALVRDSDTDELKLERLVSSTRPSGSGLDHEDHFWRRPQPLLVRPERVVSLARRVNPVISGNRANPQVTWASLKTVQWLTGEMDLDAEPIGNLLEFLEAAQTDLEAIYRVLRASGLIAGNAAEPDADLPAGADTNIRSLAARRHA